MVLRRSYDAFKYYYRQAGSANKSFKKSLVYACKMVSSNGLNSLTFSWVFNVPVVVELLMENGY